MAPTKHKKNLYITFEGIDGCGKSTQLRLTETYPADRGRNAKTLREPVSNKASEGKHAIWLGPSTRTRDTTEWLESPPDPFIRRVRYGYREIARQESPGVRVINANQSPQDVLAGVRQILHRKLTRP